MNDDTEFMAPAMPGEQRAALVVGGAVGAIIPQNVEEVWRLSNVFHRSQMAPSTLNTPEKVMVSILAGAELGLLPFQAMQSFGVINGRPVLYGDGLLAVVRSRGFRVREWSQGADDDRVAFCEVIRPDSGETIRRSYSVADAKKAQLWSKTGPWQTNPNRMLQVRARAFACRDAAADILRGFQMREEVEDYAEVVQVVPAKSGVRERLSARTTPSQEGFTVENGQHVTPEIVDAILDDDSFPVANVEVEAKPKRRGRPPKTVAEALGDGPDPVEAELDTETNDAPPQSATDAEVSEPQDDAASFVSGAGTAMADGTRGSGDSTTTNSAGSEQTSTVDNSHPTETASVLSAGATRDSLESVTGASDDTRAQASGIMDANRQDSVSEGYPEPDEVYHLTGDAWDEEGARDIYKNGELIGSDKRDSGLRIYEDHASKALPPPSAFDAYSDAMEAAKTWAAALEAMRVFYATPEFTGMNLASQNRVRRNTWIALSERDKLSDLPDPAQNVSAFRLWCESCDAYDVIEFTLAVLEKEDAFKSKPDATKKAVRDAAADRVRLLKSA